MDIEEQAVDVCNLALQRLHVHLELWESIKNDADYEWLYICARIKGKKLHSIWIHKLESTDERIEKEFGEDLNIATSFELEMLYSQETRQQNSNIGSNWNSLRGCRAMHLEYCGSIRKWAATEMLAQNLNFNRALAIYSNRLGGVISPSSINVTLFKTRQFFCDNRIDSHLLPVVTEMKRGNQLVKIESISKVSVLKSAKAMTRWLASQVDGQGSANYKYWPSRGEDSTANNAIRQWMATVCLNRAARLFKCDKIASIAAKNLEYNLSATFRSNNNLGYIWMDGTAKLGAAGLAALAIIEMPHREKYLSKEHSLYALIKSLSHKNGSFETFYIPRSRKDNQNFYSGEALLYLATRFVASKDLIELASIMKSFHFYRDWHRLNRNPAFVPWHTQAYFLVWQVTKDDELKSFIFEMNDWLLSMQEWGNATSADMQGRFYDAKRPFFGPPHASATGVYLEGLIDAYELAKQTGEIQRANNYRIVILRGLRSIIQLQFKDEVDCFYIQDVNRVLGGVRTTVYDNSIRIDNVQHALMAMLKITSRFELNDYSLSNKDISHDFQKRHKTSKKNITKKNKINSNRNAHNIELRWSKWIFNNLVNGCSPESLADKINLGGDSNKEFLIAEVYRVAAEPYICVAKDMKLTIDKRNWLLDTYDKLSALDKRYSTRIETRTVPEFSEFIREYYSKHLPVVLQKGIEHWPALKKWSPSYFLAQYGQQEIEVQYGRENDPLYERNSGRHKKKMLMSEFVDLVEHGGSSNDYYLTANNKANLSELAILFEDLGDFGQGYRMPQTIKDRSHLWFGPKGAFTPLHHDLTNNMLVQIYGRKKITLIPGFQVPNIYNDQHVYSATDLPMIDLKKFPKLKGVTPIEIILNPGEAIFIPIGWWYCVESLDISISISFTDFNVPNDFYSSYPKSF